MSPYVFIEKIEFLLSGENKHDAWKFPIHPCLIFPVSFLFKFNIPFDSILYHISRNMIAKDSFQFTLEAASRFQEDEYPEDRKTIVKTIDSYLTLQD